ncbi:hypothetical protein ABFO97_15925 [Acinetobacter baumannii]|uniref:hypothetical protein n=1 Tax=Acinetobacter baumannii TaxID=470 RepID=UPI0008199BF2|nr:hypothetical protein [Acinetobacter baumannii]EIB7122013.1 hypothetical protein [Acinetobacter baumannii]MCT9283207.1 hypothetical protein [Acinetobacter baumannii]MDC4419490.1 hypothetical protein [Acinetobacter baumannii]OTK92156.1 hypothetical protein B9X85_12510 [Acinetobacter baumannii]SCD16571.1 Uncharacterised protein [Acinetobacter baumannii]
MNLFSPPKKVSNIHFRKNEHQFVLLSLFIYQATKQKWNKNDIRKVVIEARKGNHQHLLKTLKAHSSVKY